MEFSIHIIVLLVILSVSVSSNEQTIPKKVSQFTQRVLQLGFTVKDYDVVTEDGYILKVFNIPGDKARPVLMTHGVIDSCETYIVRENISLAINLAKLGYDVWLGNNRGNRYSRRHIYLDPDNDREFWDFSFHELGYYDLPAMIDFVLKQTKQKTLTAIGHSQGTTIFFVLGSVRPEYNDKIKILIALSPVCYLNHLKDASYYFLTSMPFIDQLFTALGREEFLGDDTVIGRGFRTFCSTKDNYDMCAHGILFAIAGSDPEEMEPDFLPTVMAQYPTGTSRKNAVHISQVGMRRSFSEFDYTWRNMDIYNSTEPPEYDISKMTTKVAIITGRNDGLSTIEDVDMLSKKLPNVVEYIIVDHEKFNHIDSVWGRNMDKYLLPHVFGIMDTYS